MIVKVNAKGQITIPKKMRDSLGIKPGDSVAIYQDDDVLRLRLVRETLFDLVGSIPVPPQGPLSVDALRESYVDGIVEQFNSLEGE